MSVFIRECTVADVPELEAICQETFAEYLWRWRKRKGFTGTL